MHICSKCNNALAPSFDGAECPSCGVIFSKYFAAQAQKQSDQVRSSTKSWLTAQKNVRVIASVPRNLDKTRDDKSDVHKKDEPISPYPKTASCRACGGLVAVGVKACPHCGQAKPAPKAPTRVNSGHLVIAGIVIVLVFIGASNQPTSMNAQSTSMTAQEVVQRCARETGIDPGSSRSMTRQDIRAIDTCVNKYGFKTKP